MRPPVTQLVTAAFLLLAVTFQPSRTLSNSSTLDHDPTTASTSPAGSSWVPVSSPVLRQKSRTLDLDKVDDHQYEDVDIVTAPPHPPDTFSFVVASDFGGNNPSSRSRAVESDHPEDEVELVTASDPEWFSDWGTPAKLQDTTPTTTTTATTPRTATAKSPRRALPKILIRRRLPSRGRTTTRSPPTTGRDALPGPQVPPVTPATQRTTTAEPARPTSTATRQPIGAITSTVTPRTTSTTSTTLRTAPVVTLPPRTSATRSTATPPVTSPTTVTPYRTFVNRYGTFSDKDNTILKPLERQTTAVPGPPFRNGTRKSNGGFVAVPAKSSTKIKTGVRSGREFRDREEQRGDTVPASTSNAEKLSYILVGVCCAVSITCLVVVVTVLRCRKVRQRQRALEQLQESRNLTVSWLEKTHHAFGPGLPPAPVVGPATPGRKPNRRSTAEPSVEVPTPKPQNLWFVRREKLPFLLYDHHGPVPGPGAGPGPVSPEPVSDGGSSSLGRNLRYQNHPTGHTSGLDCAKKGELIYWSSNNEQLI